MTAVPTEPPRRAPLTVAVDGPSGSGKSTVSRRVARRLGLAYLDTGAMYRALALHCTRQGTDLDDEAAVEQAALTVPLTMVTDPAAPDTLLDGESVEPAIRATEVSTVVSRVATNLGVRAELARRQREIIEAARQRGGIVAEGRDITTVIAPDAEVRVLLLADERARLARRARQVHSGRTDEAALEATRDEVLRRDRDDSTVSQFLVAADGVVAVDTSELDLDGSVAAVLAVVEQTLAGGTPTQTSLTDQHTTREARDD